MKILSVVGTRPQFIKYAPFSKAVHGRHTDILVHTGQHYDYLLSKVFFDQLDLHQPEYNLNVGSMTQSKQIGEMMSSLDDVLSDVSPDVVVVFGDTNSTVAGALAAVKNNICVAHVESGLRSFDRKMPEELNRIITDHISTVLFASTSSAVRQLKKENIVDNVYLVGDITVETLNHGLPIAEHSNVLEQVGVEEDGFYLATIHRPSNTDDPLNLSRILNALNQIDKPVVLPLHPRTAHAVRSHRLNIGRNIKVIEPVGYFDFLWLEKNCCKVFTDSGGIQKEAYILGKPCVTLRCNTEWVETVSAGWNVLVGADEQRIVNAARCFNPVGKQRNIFGDGKTSSIIRLVLEGFI